MLKLVLYLSDRAFIQFLFLFNWFFLLICVVYTPHFNVYDHDWVFIFCNSFFCCLLPPFTSRCWRVIFVFIIETLKSIHFLSYIYLYICWTNISISRHTHRRYTRASSHCFPYLNATFYKWTIGKKIYHTHIHIRITRTHPTLHMHTHRHRTDHSELGALWARPLSTAWVKDLSPGSETKCPSVRGLARSTLRADLLLEAHF